MSNDKPEESDIKDAVIDHLAEVIEKAKNELAKIQCPEHGKALSQLNFNREQGRFDIKCCCENGEALVEKGISKL